MFWSMSMVGQFMAQKSRDRDAAGATSESIIVGAKAIGGMCNVTQVDHTVISGWSTVEAASGLGLAAELTKTY
jgi:hypothetical protein